jgi:hypothetical protein
MRVSIRGIDKPTLLVALFNSAKLKVDLNLPRYVMTTEDAQHLLDGGKFFYEMFKGRSLYFDIGGQEISTELYDVDNGEGAAEKIINKLREQGNSTIPPMVVNFRDCDRVTPHFNGEMVCCENEETFFYPGLG